MTNHDSDAIHEYSIEIAMINGAKEIIKRKRLTTVNLLSKEFHCLNSKDSKPTR